MKVMVGGTFDPLHDGHKKLIGRAFELAGPTGTVLLGLTTDDFAGRKVHPIRPFHERKADIVDFIQDEGFKAEWSIEPLSDPYGPSIDSDFSMIT